MAGDREVTVRILGDSTSAERAFKRTGDASEKVGPSAKIAQNALDDVSRAVTSNLGPAASVADDALKKVTSSAAASGNALAFGVAGGAAFAGGALAVFAADGVSSLLQLTGEVRNFQRTSGASAEDSSRFVAVLDDLGISSETGATALFKLGREVAAGAPKLRELGIEVVKNKDGTANLTETLLNVADAYARTPGQADKTSLAFAAFGKQAQGLIPLLEKGRAGLESFFAGAEEHGQILSQEDLDQARELELAIDDLGDAMRGLQLIGAKALVPFLTTVSDAGAKAIGVVAKVQEATGGALGDIAQSVVTNFAGPVGGALSLLRGKADEAGEATVNLDGGIKAITESQVVLGQATDETADALKEFKTDLDAALGSVLSEREAAIALADKVDALGRSIAENGAQTGLATDKQRNLTSSIIDVVEAAQREVDAITKSGQISSDAASQKQALIDRLEQVKQKYPQLRGPIQEYIDKINSIPDAANTKVTADTTQARADIARFVADIRRDVATVISVAAGLPGRAHGGPVSAGRPYLVGEEGPEIIVPPGAGTVIPNNRLGIASAGRTIVYSPNITVEGNVIAERDLADTMIRQFQEWVRRNGSMGL